MSDFDQRNVAAILGGVATAPGSAAETVQHHGLASLLNGTPRTMSEIASLSGSSAVTLKAGSRPSSTSGEIDLDGDRVVGVAGLTLIATAHSLSLPDADMYTWCALDAVGIPAALGLTATVETRCAQCGERITVDVNDGAPTAAGPVTLFCPTGRCDNVRADFCSAANLFCSPTHLREWRTDNLSALGADLDLAATADLGHAMWGRYRPTQDEPPAHG
jgi:hypothetical protein